VTDTIRTAAARLTGNPPLPFVAGHRVELETRNGRLVRGKVLQAGVGMAQLNIAPAGMAALRIVLIDYADVVRTREPDKAAQSGNWMPGHPGRAVALAATTGPWKAFKR
jgi:hypothetical protein